MYEVVVGNIGTVLEGEDPVLAKACYDRYVALSLEKMGRAAGEPVTLFNEGKVAEHHTPPEVKLKQIVIVGNPVDGFQFFGPFDDAIDACEWADDRMNESGHPDWWVAPLKEVTFDADNQQEPQLGTV